MTTNAPAIYRPQTFILYVLGLTTLVAAMASFYWADGIFLATGLTALLIVLAPMLGQRHIEWFSPWIFVCLTVFLGCTVTGFCISFDYPDPDKIEQWYRLGLEPGDFVYPCLILLAGLGAMSYGYFGRSKTQQASAKQFVIADGTRLGFCIAVLFLISLFATYRYIENTGGLFSGQLSGKRTVIFDLNVKGDTEFNQFGPLRQFSSLAAFAYYIVLAYSLKQARTITPTLILLWIVFFMLACALPFYSSSRLPIAWLFIGTGAVVWYSGRNVSLKRIFVIALIGAAVFHSISVLRNKDSISKFSDDRSRTAALVDSLVLTRNYVGIGKTSHIINAVPELLPFTYGKTIGVWLFAPIPRSMWSNKPLIHSGPVIGSTIYGSRVSGVPPGMIAELYWGFHIPGVLFGCWFVGRLLRYVADRYKPRRGSGSLSVVIYVVGPMRFGFEVLGNSVGFALLTTAADMVTAIAILHLIGTRTPLAQRRSEPHIFGTKPRDYRAKAA